MSERDPEPIDLGMLRRVSEIDSITPPEDNPELIVLCCIFYKLDQIKQQLDLVLK
jgi:hypothetical protein